MSGCVRCSEDVLCYGGCVRCSEDVLFGGCVGCL